MLGEIFVEIFFGGLTGYVTNDTAIKSLFKDGGVIDAQRADLIGRISNLLEERLFSADVLHDYLSTPEVQAVLAEHIGEWLDVYVPQGLALMGQADEALIIKLAEGWRVAVNQWFAQHRAAFLHTFGTSDGGLFRPELAYECQVLAQHVGEETGETTGNLTDFLASVLTELAQVSLTDLQLGAADDAIQAASASFFLQEEAWQTLWQGFWQEEEVVALLTDHCTTVVGNPLAHLFADGGKSLCADLGGYFQTTQGEQLWADLWRIVVYTLNGQMVPLTNLFSDQGRGFVHEVGTKQIPFLTQTLLQALHQYADVVEEMILSGIDGTLGVDDGAKRRIKSIVQERYLAKNDVQVPQWIDRLGEWLTTPEKYRQLEKMFLELVLDYGGECQINELARQYLTQGPVAASLEAYCKEAVQQVWPQVVDHLWAQWSAQPLQVLLPATLDGKRLGEQLGAGLVASGGNPRIWHDAGGRLQKKVGQLSTIPLGTWLLQEDRCQQLAEELAVQIRMKAVQLLAEPADVLGLIYDRLGEVVAEGFADVFSGAADLSAVLGEEKNSLLAHHLAQEAVPLLAAVGPSVIRGAGHQQMTRMSPTALRKMVYQLLGNDLKPLSYLGAALGGAAGLATGCLVTGPLAPLMTEASGSGMIMAGRTLMYGAIGYGTNVAAVKGLFWPYEPIAGHQSWQGIIPKNQERFARSMGKVIEERIFTPAVAQGPMALAAYHQYALQVLSHVQEENTSAGDGGQMLLQNRLHCLQQLMQPTSGQFLQQLLPQINRVEGLTGETWQRMLAQPLVKMVGEMGHTYVATMPCHRFVPQELKHRGTVRMIQAGQQALADEALGKKIDQFLQEICQQTTLANVIAKERYAQLLQGCGMLLLDKGLAILPAYVPVIADEILAMVEGTLFGLKKIGYYMTNMDEAIAKVVAHLLLQQLPVFATRYGDELVRSIVDHLVEETYAKPLAALGVSWPDQYAQGIQEWLATSAAIPLGVRRIAGEASGCSLGQAISYLAPEQRSFFSAKGEALLSMAYTRDETQAWLNGVLHHFVGESDFSEMVTQQLLRVAPHSMAQAEMFCQSLVNQVDWQQMLDWDRLEKWFYHDGDDLVQPSAALRQGLIVWLSADGWTTLLPQWGEALVPLKEAYLAHSGPAFLHEMAFGALAEQQIVALTPAELEALVRSFADPYFTHIEKRGWLGALISIPGMLLYYDM